MRPQLASLCKKIGPEETCQPRTLLKDTELMSQYQDFRLQPPSRLEAVTQHTD
jgi:hypothetical protein